MSSSSAPISLWPAPFSFEPSSVILLLLCLCWAKVQAQEPPSTPEVESPKTAQVAVPIVEDDAPDSTSPPSSEEAATAPLDQKGFLRLWKESQLEDKLLRQKPPVDGSVKHAKYLVSFLGEPQRPTSILLKAVLELESFRPGWSSVNLSPVSLPIIDAETGAGFLALDEKGYRALLPDRGSYTFELSLFAPIAYKDGLPVAQINLPESPLTALEGTLPGRGWEFSENDQTGPISLKETEEGTEFSFSPAASSFSLSWENPTQNAANEPVLISEIESFTHILRDSIRTESSIHCTIPRAAIDQLQLTLDGEQEILSLSGEGISDWNLTKGDGAQLISITFDEPQSEAYQLELILEQAIPALPFAATIPEITVLGAIRQSGIFDILEDQEISTRVNLVSGLERLPAGFENAPHERFLGRYRYGKPGFQAQLQLEETVARVSAYSFTDLQILPQATRFDTEFQLEIEGRGLLENAITLPDGYQIAEVYGEHLRDHTIMGRRLTLSYSVPQLGPVHIQIRGIRERSSLGSLTLPQFAVDASDDYQATLEWEAAPSLTLSLASDSSSGFGPLPESFHLVSSADPITLQVSERAPQVNVTVDSQIQLLHYETLVETTLSYQIQHRMPERLFLRVPEAWNSDLALVSETLEVAEKGAELKEHTKAGESIWTLAPKKAALGAHKARLFLHLRHPQIDYNQISEHPSVLILPHGANQLQGTLEIAQEANVEVSTPVESAILTMAAEPQKKSFSFTSEIAALGLEVTRLRYAQQPKVAVDLASLTHSVAGDGSVSTEASYRLLLEAPSPLSVNLPAGATLRSDFFCNDEPIPAIEQGSPQQLEIQLRPEPARDSGKPEEFIIRFAYDVPPPSSLDGLENIGAMAVPVARLTPGTKIFQSETQLYLPPSHRYIGFETTMIRDESPRGWARAKSWVQDRLPSFLTPETSAPVAGAPVTSPMPEFTFPVPLRREGAPFSFDHTAAPEPVQISYVSQQYATILEAGAFFVVLLFGILVAGQRIEPKLVFLIFTSALPLVAAGLVAPHLSSVYQAVVAGSLCSIVLWLLVAIVSLFRALQRKTEPQPVAIPAQEQPSLGGFSQLADEEEHWDEEDEKEENIGTSSEEEEPNDPDPKPASGTSSSEEKKSFTAASKAKTEEAKLN